MMEFFAEYYGSIIVGAVVVAACVVSALVMIKDKREGKSSCGGNCAGCHGACKACAEHSEVKQ